MPRLGDEGGDRNRYDDPHDLYRIRYMAERLTGVLVETMARFRPSAAAEAFLTDVEDGGTNEDEASHPDPRQAVADWLRIQRVGRLTLVESIPIIDIHDAQLLVILDKHPLVRAALDAATGLGTSLTPARPDEGIIRLSGPIGRPITQAVSRAVYEWLPDAGGLGYFSRLDDRERCWALREGTPVQVDVQPLTPDNAE